MPVTVRRIDGKYRIVDPSSGAIERTPSGKPRDGGGHPSRAAALRQMRAMNMAYAEKSLIKFVKRLLKSFRRGLS